MRRFYAPKENFKDGKVILSLEETRHLRDVLRSRAGEKARIFDGEGREFSCEIQSIAKKETVLKILEETAPTSPESNLDLTLAVALLKGEKYDLVVQKAVELGATKLIPLNTKRGDVKLKDADKKIERWRKIALEAAKQSGRARLMRIENPVDFNNFIETASDARILFAERSGEDFSAVKSDIKITAVIGSEGGWEDFEIEAARRKGFRIVTFSGRILRAETATIAIAAILQHRFGDLN
jgi:16S rRNA (uracil1498-N3)-methyltransferase